MFRSFIELLTPISCIGCGRESASLCDDCLLEVRLQQALCFNCGRVSTYGRTCEICIPKTFLRGVTVGAHYEGAVKELILQLKFHRLRSARDAAAQIVLGRLPEGLGIDLVTSVPVSPSRYRERGYNQAELLGRSLAGSLSLPYANLMTRSTSEHQMGLDRTRRLAKVRGVFTPTRRADSLSVLVVDDVITTGATLSECAAALTEAGAARVWGAAVARH